VEWYPGFLLHKLKRFFMGGTSDARVELPASPGWDAEDKKAWLDAGAPRGGSGGGNRAPAAWHEHVCKECPPENNVWSCRFPKCKGATHRYCKEHSK
jgi:hypothetical protein